MKKQTTPDRRVQRTRQLLLNALIGLIPEKGYEAITVQDIIDRANVGRSTFYSHFQDKEDLLLSGSESLYDVFQSFHDHTARDESNWDFSLALFQHAEQHRQGFKALLGQQAGDVMRRYLQRSLTAYLVDHFRDAYPNKEPRVPLDVFVQYFVSTFFGLLTWWLDTDARCSAQEMNSYFRALTEPTTRTMLHTT